MHRHSDDMRVTLKARRRHACALFLGVSRDAYLMALLSLSIVLNIIDLKLSRPLQPGSEPVLPEGLLRECTCTYT